ncbi:MULTISPECIES: GGDEF domain-containing protein [unclassified Roseitalea]|uniref:GGDEF domain-containing protein n=1 Tax=unclassified Roseitalea TaxID=2639107 RepID=UPI00273DFA3D|nr:MULTISPECIES: GGDEF domain-containing protein [unclassified Roseitalea]
MSGPWPGGPGAWTDPAGLPVILSRFVTIVLIAAVLFGLAWLYPVIRRDAHERGRLARESRSYMEAALTDPLTGLQNRRYFDDALGEFMREFGSIDRPLAMLILDIDHFKQVNDTYGHDGGDMVLRAVSLCLLQHTRYHDVLARIGGEEFAVILPNTDAPALQRIAERIRAAIADLPVVLKETRVPITASFGIAVWDGGENAQALIKRADENLYAAKSGGRNRVASTGQASETARPAAPAQPIFGTGLSTPGSNRTARSGRAQAGR